MVKFEKFMTERSDKSLKDTALEWFGIACLVVFAISCSVQFLRLIGVLEPIPPSVEKNEKPRFDRNECIMRYSYQFREDDPLMSDDRLHGEVARACVIEQEKFEGW
jgi:hypothetical protein